MRVRFARQAVLGIVLICQLSACLATETPDPNESSKYLDAVREFADNVLKYGRDTYGPKHTPLFVDGLNIHTHEPVKWIAPNGDRWILSNLASQQTLMRTLDGLSTITGDPKYKQAAMDAIRYAFENLRSPNGLLYWGGHEAYDAGADRPCGRGIHEFKANYPYYELMWKVDPQATKQFIEAFWSAHVLDWSNLDFNRHASLNNQLEKSWIHEYKGGPIFFKGKGVTFSVTGSDLYYAAALLTKLSGDEEPLIWGKRLSYRYVETRDPKTGISFRLYTQQSGWSALKDLLADDFKRDVLFDGMEFPANWKILPVHMEICRLLLGEQLRDEGKEFTQWALEELTAMGKASYRKRDNSFIPILIDGTNLEGYVFKKDCSYGPKGTILKAMPADSLALWTYALAYRITGDEFMWEMVRDIAEGNGFGDIEAASIDGSELTTETDSSDCYALLAFLELYRTAEKRAFLRMACMIGDNILSHRFYKGFFVESEKYIYTRCDTLESLALLHLCAMLKPYPSALPSCWLNRPLFEAPYRYKGETQDSAIYMLTDSSELPISLDEAATMGDITLAKSLLAKGVNINETETEFLITPLHSAARAGHKEMVEFLIVNGADLDAKGDWPRETPLHGAAERGHKEIVEVLLNHGADINSINRSGETPLQYAAYSNNKDIIELLLQKGATIANLHIASYMGDLEKAEAFINEGVDIDALDGRGLDAPLHYAARNNQKQVIELLTAKGADVNLKNRPGQTPLDIAISQGHKDIAELLISKGADINAKDNRGNTLLHRAAQNDQKDIAELLISRGADINAKNNKDKTPLHYAVKAGNVKIVELLISRGANTKVLNKAGRTPLDLAVGQGNTEIVELLKKHGAKE